MGTALAFIVLNGGFDKPAVADTAFELPPAGEPSPGPVITLADAVAGADVDNRSLMVIRQDIMIAAEKLRASWSGLLPAIYGSMNWAFGSQQQVSQAGTASMSTEHQMSAGVSLTVPLIDARTWLEMDSVEISSDVTKLQVEETRQILLYSVAEAYFQAAAALSLIEVYKAQYDTANEYLEFARGRLDAGVGNIMDVKSAQSDLLTAWTGMVTSGYSLADAREGLALLMGTDELPMPVVADSATGRNLEVTEDALRALSDSAIEIPDVAGSISDRWDMKTLMRRQDLVKSQLGTSYMSFVPSLDGFFNYSYNILGQDSIPGYDPNQWTLGLRLSVPIFDYTIYPGLRQQKALVRQSELQVDSVRAEAEKTVRETRRALCRLFRLVAAAKVKSALTDDMLELAQIDYANGTGLVISVSDARQKSLSAHVDLATATYEYEMGLLSLNRELGVDIRTVIQTQ